MRNICWGTHGRVLHINRGPQEHEDDTRYGVHPLGKGYAISRSNGPFLGCTYPSSGFFDREAMASVLGEGVFNVEGEFYFVP